MSGYALTRAADADMVEIARYTAGRWGYDRAEAYLLSLEAAVGRLDTPLRLGGRPGSEMGTFRHDSGSHVVFYPKEAFGGVLIVRVLHRRMELMRHIEADSSPG